MSAYIMESPTEGQRIERKTNCSLTLEQLSWAGIQRGHRVLDLGCAAGTSTRLIASIVGNSGLAVGVDRSPQRIEEASRYADHQGSIEYRCGLAEAIPAVDGEFDLCWSRFLFEYLPDPQAAIREMTRVTKPGGWVAVSDLDGNCIWHDPMTVGFSVDLEAALRLLGQQGFDPLVGRKLYRMAWRAGLQDIKVDVRPYHVIAGKMSEETEGLWCSKLETVYQTLLGLGMSRERVRKLREEYLNLLLDEGSFTYSALISVTGRRPFEEPQSAS
jgi:SAM-dependent methyltransferase